MCRAPSDTGCGSEVDTTAPDSKLEKAADSALEDASGLIITNVANCL